MSRRIKSHQRSSLRGAIALLAAVLCTGAAIDAQAQRPRRRPPQEQAQQPQAQPTPEAPEAEEKKPDEPDRWLAIEGARVHTVSGGVLDNVTVLCKNGRILQIAPAVTIPDGAEVIDATGYELYPGLIAVSSRGIIGGGNPDDSTDVFDFNVTLALAGGITTAVSGNQAAKLTYGVVEEEEMILSRDLFESFRYSTSRPNERYTVRQQLDRVRQYLRDLNAWNVEKTVNPDLTEPDKQWIRGNYEKYLRLMRGEATALIDANTVHELLDIAELSEEYGIRFVVQGAYEAWAAAPQLARADIAAIVTPRTRVDVDRDLLRPNGSSIENAAILEDHGITIAILPVGSGFFMAPDGISLMGLAGRDLQHLPMEAAFAVRGGMSNEEAIRAITVDAARVLGIDDRVGSIEIGKDADFVIATGDLLHYTTQPRWTIVNGRIAYDKEKETVFSHIRPGGDADAPPPADYWPKRFNPPWLGEQQ